MRRSSSPANAQLNLPLLPNSERALGLGAGSNSGIAPTEPAPISGAPSRDGSPSLPNQEQRLHPLTTEADAVASEIFDVSLTAARVTSQEAAYLLGVSESMVRKMRNVNAREGVSFAQELSLPLSYHLAKHRVMNRRFGFWRHLLGRVFEELGSFALAVGE